MIPTETITKPLPSDYHSSTPDDVEFFVESYIKTYGALYASIDEENQNIIYVVR